MRELDYDYDYDYSTDEAYNDNYMRSYPFAAHKRISYFECGDEEGEFYDDEYQRWYE